MTLKVFTAKEAKNTFGKLIDSAQREPVIVTKKNRPVVVVLSIEDAEDKLLLKDSLLADAEWYIWREKSDNLLKSIENA